MDKVSHPLPLNAVQRVAPTLLPTQGGLPRPLKVLTTTSLLKHFSRSYLSQFFLLEAHQKVFLVKSLP